MGHESESGGHDFGAGGEIDQDKVAVAALSPLFDLKSQGSHLFDTLHEGLWIGEGFDIESAFVQWAFVIGELVFDLFDGRGRLITAEKDDTIGRDVENGLQDGFGGAADGADEQLVISHGVAPGRG